MSSSAKGEYVYNLPSMWHLVGPLNILALRRSLAEMKARHNILHATFTLVQELPIQIVVPTASSLLPVIDLQALPADNREKEILRLFAEEERYTFDLTRGPCVRFALLRQNDQEHILLLNFHQIIADDFSIEIFVQELITLYAAFSCGAPLPFPDLSTQYTHFAVEQQEWLQGEDFQEHLVYWKQRLADAPQALSLPFDHPRSALQTLQTVSQSFVLSQSLSEDLRALSRREGVTLFIMLLAAFQALLARYSQQQDILIGSPITHRSRSEFGNVIGNFTNTLLVRTDFSGEPTFRELLRRVYEAYIDTLTYQKFPFESIIDEFRSKLNMGNNSPVQVMFSLQELTRIENTIPDLSISLLKRGGSSSQSELSLLMWEEFGGLVGTLRYNAGLFEDVTISRMLEHFRLLLSNIVANPAQPLSRIPLLTEGERHQLLVEWNGRQVTYPDDICVHHLFEQQVARTPDATAVTADDAHLTYQELDRLAQKLAIHLRGLGVGPEVFVGICMERSLELPVALLGVLKAGGAYVPLDPAYPDERLHYMLQDAQLSLVLTQEHLEGQIPADHIPFLRINIAWLIALDEPRESSYSPVQPEHPVYMIYTSGSTGQPKGVVNRHRSLCNRLYWMQDAYHLTGSDRVLQKTPLSFDVSAWEFFLATHGWGSVRHGSTGRTPR